MRSSIWSGSISFGLINVPVTVESAEQDKDLHFNLLDKRNLARVRFNRVNDRTGKPVPSAQIIKGYAYAPGKYVLMTDADFKNANPRATQTIDIETFVKVGDIDLLLFERPYFLVPKKGGEKAYHLLKLALERSGKVAIAKVVMHTKEHLTCIFARGDHLVLEIMRFAHTLKKPEKSESKSVPKFKPQELKMAEQLIAGMTTRWDPSQYEDTYYDDLMKHIRSRIDAGNVKEIETEVHAEEKPAAAPASTDLMQLLKRSLRETPRGPKKKPSAHRHVH